MGVLDDGAQDEERDVSIAPSAVHLSPLSPDYDLTMSRLPATMPPLNLAHSLLTVVHLRL